MDLKVILNGIEYQLKNPPSVSRTPAFAPVVRTSAEQGRAQAQPVPQYSFEDISGGIGSKTWDVDDPSILDASCDTLWGSITLPILTETASTSGMLTTDQITAMEEYDGVYYGFYVNASGNLRIARWVGSSWEALDGTIASSISTVRRAKRLGVKLYVLVYTSAGFLNLIYSVTPGTAPSGTPWTTIDFSSTIKTKGDIAILDNAERVYVVGKTTTGNLTMKSVAYSGDSVSAEWLSIPVPSGTGEISCEMFLNQANVDSLFIGLSYAVVLVKADSASSPTQKPVTVLDLIESPDNCHTIKKFGGKLYIPLKDMGLLEYEANGTTLPVGLDQKDGFPKNRIGYIKTLFPEQYRLWVSVTGNTGNLSGIYVWDTDGWHTKWLDTTNSSIYDLAVAGTVEPILLWSPIAGSFKYLVNPHINPILLSSTKYEVSGTVDYPYFGGYLPEVQGLFPKISVYATNLKEDARYIEIFYKLDEDTAYTYLGRIDDVTQILDLNKTGKTIQLRCKLNRGLVNTDTPILYYPIIYMDKSSAKLSIVLYLISNNNKKTIDNLQKIAISDTAITVGILGKEYLCLVDGASWQDSDNPMMQLRLKEI